jgi:hypothetical protein
MDGNTHQGILTPRALEVLATCPARFDLEYVRGLRRLGARPASANDSRGAGIAAAIGARWSALLERSWWLPEVLDRLNAADHAARDAERALHGWAGRSNAAPADVELCRAVLAHYATQHPIEEDAARAQRAVRRRARPAASPTIAANAAIEAVLPYRFLGEPVRLRVRVPLLHATSKDTAELFVTYTTGTSYRGEVTEDRRLDMRVLASAWAAARWSRRSVDTVIFDVVRTTPPREPATLRCPKCHGTGSVPGLTPGSVPCFPCAGSGVSGISRAACDTTIEVWDRTVLKHPHLDRNTEAAAASELLNKLQARGDTFAYRVSTGIRPADLAGWLADVRVLFIAAKAWARRGRWPRNPAACIGVRGYCPYRDYCRGTSRDDDETPYFQKLADPAAWDEVNP